MDFAIARKLFWPKRKTPEREEIMTNVVVVATDVPSEIVGIVGGWQVDAGGCPVWHSVFRGYAL